MRFSSIGASLGMDFAVRTRHGRACRRAAPPGFRATPRAVFAVTAIRLQSLTPSRLRRCALRLPPGESPAGYPRRTLFGARRCAEPALPDRPGQRPAAMGGALANTLALAAAKN